MAQKPSRETTVHAARPLRGLGVLLAAGLTTFVLWRLPQLSPSSDTRIASLAWVLAILLCLSAVASWRFPSRWSLRDALRSRRWELLALLAICLVGFVARAWRMGDIPHTLGGDECNFGGDTLKVLRGEYRNPFVTGIWGQPTMNFFCLSWSVRLLGRTAVALRLPWMLVGALSLFAAFFLVRRLKGTRLALLTTALLATYHYHVHFSRLGTNNISDPLFGSLILLFFYRGLDGRKLLDWAIGGAICGVGLYFYTGARFFPILIAMIVGYMLLYDRLAFLRRHGIGLLVFLGALVVAAAPMIQYALRHPDQFNARLKLAGVYQSGWMESEMAARKTGEIAILADQFRRAALAFNYYPEKTYHYALPEPFLDPLFGAIYLLGLGYGALRALGPRADRRIAPFVAWWLGVTLLAGTLTQPTPNSPRFLTLALPVCFFVALGMDRALTLAKDAFPRTPTRALLVCGWLCFSIISLKTYFLDFSPRNLYAGIHWLISTDIAPRMNELAPTHRIHFFGAPAMYWTSPTLKFLVPKAEGGDVLEPLKGPAPQSMVPEGGAAVFVFLEARLGELAQVKKTFPDGITETVTVNHDGRPVTVTLYRVSRAEEPGGAKP